jgi:hypothetical protein
MKIKNILFIIFACVLSVQNHIFASQVEPLETSKASELAKLKDASPAVAAAFKEVLQAVGLGEEIEKVVIKKTAPNLFELAWDKEIIALAVNEESLAQLSQELRTFRFYEVAMYLKHRMGKQAIKESGALTNIFLKVTTMQSVLGALCYLLKEEKYEIVGAWLGFVSAWLRSDNPVEHFKDPSYEAYYRYCKEFVRSWNAGKGPFYNAFAITYFQELFLGEAKFKCKLVVRKDEQGQVALVRHTDLQDGEASEVILQDGEWIIDCSQNVTPEELPEDMTPQEAFAKLHPLIFGS